ncbi:hypothetical protein V6O07_17850, partial [Arthrospira platensis SPKY2]
INVLLKPQVLSHMGRTGIFFYMEEVNVFACSKHISLGFSSRVLKHGNTVHFLMIFLTILELRGLMTNS